MNLWLDQRTGSKPRPKRESQTVDALCNDFLNHKRQLMENGELAPRATDILAAQMFLHGSPVAHENDHRSRVARPAPHGHRPAASVPARREVVADLPKQGLSGADRILDICRCENATTYINPPGGRELYDRARFLAAGMELLCRPYRHSRPLSKKGSG